MTRKAAPKLSFTPDDYFVSWQLPSLNVGTLKAYSALTIEADKPPKGAAHGSFAGHLERMAGGGTGFP